MLTQEEFEELRKLIAGNTTAIHELVTMNVRRIDGCLERIDMMADILEQSVSLLKIKGTQPDFELIQNVTNMVAACRRFTSDQRLINETELIKIREL